MDDLQVASPILVLGTGQRCGSTLIQRLLCSHPEIMIWGEHAGVLREVLHSTTILKHWTQRDGRLGREEWAEKTYNGFIANMTPSAAEIEAATISFVKRLYCEPTKNLGKRRWGFKEVRYGLEDLRAFRYYFPHLRAIHIIRDPRGILSSLDEWERFRPWEWSRGATEAAIKHWFRIATEFINAIDELDSGLLQIRYEDLMRDPSDILGQLGDHIAIDPADFDMSVLDHHVHREGPLRESFRQMRAWKDLPISIRRLVAGDDFRQLAIAYGYDF